MAPGTVQPAPDCALNAKNLFWHCDAVVFDLDGTLAQTLEGLHLALNEALRAHGYAPVPRDLVRASMHGGFLTSVQAALGGTRAAPAGAGHEAGIVATYRARYRELMSAHSVVYPQVREVLAAQRHRGARLAVCSNRDEDLVHELLRALDLQEAFDTIVGMSQGLEPKPHPRLLLRSLQALGVTPARAVMVGDSAADKGCAVAAGVPLLVFDGGYGADALGPDTGTARFASYRELLDLAVISRPTGHG